MEGFTSPDQEPGIAVAGPAGDVAADEYLGRANRLAVMALICATCVPFLFVSGILGTVFGMVALDEIDEADGPERGQGMAKWAIGLGFLNVAVSCVVVVLLVDLLKN